MRRGTGQANVLGIERDEGRAECGGMSMGGHILPRALAENAHGKSLIPASSAVLPNAF